MYRQYEDPHKLQQQLEEAQQRLAENPDDEDYAIEVESLKERINFAWQDDEYDCDYMRDNYPEDYCLDQ